MSSQNIVRAWKDAAYRNSLTEAERAALPANPAGAIELSDADLGWVGGGRIAITAGCTRACSVGCTLACTLACTVVFPYC